MNVDSIPRLMLVTDRLRSSQSLPDLARQAVDGGVDAIQVREKDLKVARLRDVVEEIREAVSGSALGLVNGSLDVAIELQVGLHLPESMPIPAEVELDRFRIPIVGRSVHSVDAARESVGMDYLIAGHIFATSSKSGVPPIGLTGLSEIVTAAPCPVLAIGGIRPERVQAVLETGAHGVAVMSGIGTATDPAAAARAYREKLDGGTMVDKQAGTNSLIDVTVNGKPVELPDSITIQDFLNSRNLHQNMVVVEHNGQILKRGQFTETPINPGDVLEVVHFVGGG